MPPETKAEETTVATGETTTTQTTETEKPPAVDETKKGAETTAAPESTDGKESTVETKSTEQAETQTTESKAESETIERLVPEADKYNLPEGMSRDVATFARENDMTQDQLDKTLTQFGGYIDASKKQEQAVIRQQGDAHVKSWGEKSAYNLSLVRRAVAQNDPDGVLTKVLDDTGFGNHPVVLDFFLNLGTQLKEGGFLKGSVNRPPGKKTAAQSMFGKDHPSSDT